MALELGYIQIKDRRIRNNLRFFGLRHDLDPLFCARLLLEGCGAISLRLARVNELHRQDGGQSHAPATRQGLQP